jgi:L-threonylcarbamoyladenylate synthase
MPATLLVPISDPTAVGQALSVLQQGGLVAFPTDTVYGLAAPAFSNAGIERLFQAKDRDTSRAIAVLIGSADQLELLAASVSQVALRLAQRFWPGPLTLVVPRHPSLPGNLSPLPTIGVRMPDHEVALALLRLSGPLATTSANLSGGPNPLTAQDVLAQLDGRVDLILDGGPTPGGTPSTVVDCTTPNLRLLREGPLSLEDLQEAL